MEMRDERDTRKIAAAILLSVFIHLAVITGAVIVLKTPSHSPAPPAPAPVELTLLPAPAPAPAPDAYLATTEAQRSETPPEEKTFESDKDTRASSEKAAANNLPVPSQEGREDKNLQFEDRQFTLGPTPLEQPPMPPNPARPLQASRNESKPAETPPPQTKPDEAKPEQAKPEATPNPNELALLKLKPQLPKVETPKPELLQPAQPPAVGSSRVDLQACKLEYSIVSPK